MAETTPIEGQINIILYASGEQIPLTVNLSDLGEKIRKNYLPFSGKTVTWDQHGNIVEYKKP